MSSDHLTARAAAEWRADRDRSERLRLRQPSVRDAVDSAIYDAIAEFGEVASECAGALVWSARERGRRRCALYVRQLAATVRTLLVTVGELDGGSR
jgi:hypothetical protein